MSSEIIVVVITDIWSVASVVIGRIDIINLY